MQRFVFGLPAAILLSIMLFGFATWLIRAPAGPACVDCAVDPTLAQVFKSKPPEEKIRRQEQAPEPPAEPPRHSIDTDIDPPPVLQPVPEIDPRLFSGIANGGIRIGKHDMGVGYSDGGLVATRQVIPQYPPRALRESIEGEVTVEFTVGADGSVSEITIIDASPRGVFEAAVRRAIAGWAFRPAVRAGKPVATRVRQTLDFSLPEKR